MPLACLHLRGFQFQLVFVIYLAFQGVDLKVGKKTQITVLVSSEVLFLQLVNIFLMVFFFLLPLYPHSGVHRHSTSCPVGSCASAG